MGFGIVEERPTPKEVYNWRVYTAALMAAFGAVIFGYDSGFIGGTIALPSFANEFFTGGVTGSHPAQSANVVSTYQCGAIIGALITYPIAERWGRRTGIFFAGFTNILGAVLQLCASPATGLGIFYAGRVIGGMGVGSVSMVVPIYIAEISPTGIRGRLVGFYELLLQCGGLIGFWIPYAVNQHIVPTSSVQWRIPVGLQLVPAGILCLGALLLTESPRWLLKRGQDERAIKNLTHLRNLSADHSYIVDELASIRNAIALETGLSNSRGRFSVFREIALPGNRNRLGTACLVMVFQNLTGINAINYYSPTIFKSLGVQGTSTGLFSTGIYGVVKTVTTLIFCFFLVDRFPRRRIFIVGSIGGCLAMYYIGAYIAIAKPAVGKDLGGGGISAIAMIYVFAVFFCVSWNGLSWIYASEIFAIQIRGVCMAITAAVQWMAQFVIARSTPYMISGIGYGTYLFFGSWMVVMGLWVFFFLKETRGVTLEQMDDLFGLAEQHRLRNDVEKDSIEQKETVTGTSDRGSTEKL